ncbi:MAG: alpha/beta fold hydrolase [Candidatus Thorarchaeota archaeon]
MWASGEGTLLKEGIDLPYATIGEVDIYYEIHGPPDAPPLVLIGGWASYRWVWFRQIPTLMQKYKCIVFDNRGAGKSSKPDYPYTIEMMAGDTVGLLDVLGIENAHILGISMGGLIAQQIALSHPEKVRSLILVSTHFGGSNYIPIPDDVVALLVALPTETISYEQAREMRYRATFSEQFIAENKELMKQIDSWVQQHPAPLFAQVHQSSATAEFDSESELKNITVPTLILQGANDFTILPKNAELLAERIPNSRLQFIEGAAHFVIIEKYEEFNNAVMNFIDEVEQG